MVLRILSEDPVGTAAETRTFVKWLFKMTMESSCVFPVKMVIFHTYVSLPEGSAFTTLASECLHVSTKLPFLGIIEQSAIARSIGCSQAVLLLLNTYIRLRLHLHIQNMSLIF